MNDADPRAALLALRAEVGKAVVGQDAAITGLVIALLCRGHVLLEGVPGTAKTLMVRALAASLVRDGHETIVLSRDPERGAGRMPEGVRLVRWDGRTAEGYPVRSYRPDDGYEGQIQSGILTAGSLDDLHQEYPATDTEALAPRNRPESASSERERRGSLADRRAP